MSDEVNPNEPPVMPDVNPYGVSSAMESFEIQTIPRSYWGILAVLMLAAVGVTFLVPTLGCLGIAVVFFGFLRSVAYARCIRLGLMYQRSEELQRDYVPFLLTNLAIGFLATITGGIAFVSSCIPLGFGVFTVGTSFGTESMSILVIGLILVCTFLGIVSGWFIIRITLPKIETGTTYSQTPNQPPFLENPRE